MLNDLLLGDYLSGGIQGIGLLSKKPEVRVDPETSHFGVDKRSLIQWLPNFVLYLGIASVAQGESSGFVNRRSSVRIRPLAP